MADCYIFFFQAEDGIRYLTVTGVQTCALPILTRASRALFVDREWTHAANQQAVDRLHRIGQASSVSVTMLVADHTLDRRISELIKQKREHQRTGADVAVVAGEVADRSVDRLRALVARLERLTAKPPIDLLDLFGIEPQPKAVDLFDLRSEERR